MKNIESTAAAIRTDGGLTPRQKEVVSLAAKGLNALQIAMQLNLQKCTVHTHFKNIHRKLGVHNRAELVTVALRLGMVDSRLPGTAPLPELGSERNREPNDPSQRLSPSSTSLQPENAYLVLTDGAEVKYCPQCGCNVRVVAAALAP